MINRASRNILKNIKVVKRNFCAQPKVEPEIKNTNVEPEIKNTKNYTFQAETKKLLNIVAKSLYTDKDVFLRELLSNCSDALEKQKFHDYSNPDDESEPYNILIHTDENKRQLVIQDTGIGMSKEELVQNLGTIAKSGSAEFIKNVENSNSKENIIGQFGVGFYSSFIVGDTIEVYSKKDNQENVWISDGSGEFEVGEAKNLPFTRGTKIVIHLKSEYAEFCQQTNLKKIIDKYSNFIQYPIFLNGEKVNILGAIWTKNKNDVTETEYMNFFEHCSKSKMPFKYKVHFSSDAPLSMKGLLYVPSTHNELYGMGQEEIGVSLYSRKVLIKEKCKELVPSYLRFVKGVIDCEDLPLNISRENYQDSALMNKLKSIVTKKILNLLKDNFSKNPEEYKKWFKNFMIFFKEGLHSDPSNKELLFSLQTYDSTFGKNVTLDDYIKVMKPEQNKIYYLLAQSDDIARSSPFMEPYLNNDVPVLYIQINIDEMIFTQMKEYKNFVFVNIESSEEIPESINKKNNQDVEKEKNPIEEDLPFLCMWMKNELQPSVTNVIVSKRLVTHPAIVISKYSTGMRQMIQMMDQVNANETTKNLTLEINGTHPIITKLNELRKYDLKQSSQILKQIYDTTLLNAGIPFDTKNFIQNINSLIDSKLDISISNPNKKLEDKTEQIIENTVDNEKNVSNILRDVQEDLNKEDKEKENQMESNQIKLDKDGNPIIN